MAFPETRPTLIQRIAAAGTEADWRQFMGDYWGPVCRFAANRSGIPATDAEDVASLTFEALLTNRLLARWVLNRSAKLRTLLCSVVRNILSNRVRVEHGRARLLRQQVEMGALLSNFQGLDAADDQVEAFYVSWVDEILERVVQALCQEYHAAGKGDYFRVLYGRICEEMSMPEIAKALDIPLTSAENYFKSARKRLGTQLEESVRQHVARYCDEADQEHEWQAEWSRLGDYLTMHGGLEQALRRTMAERSDFHDLRRTKARIDTTLIRVFASTGGSPSGGSIGD